MGQFTIKSTTFQTVNYIASDDNTASAIVVRDSSGNIAVSGVSCTKITSAAGDSTAATGTTNADAATLPAGTSSFYPTTGATDATGVIINAADNVAGRVIFIGNGVSNKILKVYPTSGGTINGGSANAAFSSASGKGVIVYALGSGAYLAW